MKWIALVVLCAGCSDDAPASPITYTGGYEDWDSTDDNFLGVFDATVTEVGNASNTAQTAPNGRSTLELPGGTVSQVTWEAAGYVTGRATVDPTAGLGEYSLRGITEARIVTWHEDNGLTYDDTRTLVLIEVRHPVTGAVVDGVAVTVDGTEITNPGERHFPAPNVDPGDVTLVVTGATCTYPAMVHAEAGELALATAYCE